MAPSSTLGWKGKVTVPLEIRRRLGLKQGDRVEFVVEGEWTIIRPVQEKNPFEKYAGVLSAFHFEGELDAWLSDLRDEDTTDQ
jgi:antitoxin PrlF